MAMFHSSTSCRLCINICNVYQSLYHADGRKSKVCQLMEIYFTPMFLNMDRGRHLTVICTECWRHIFEFYNFQQSVLLAQRKLDEIDQQSSGFALAGDGYLATSPTIYRNELNSGSSATSVSTLPHNNSNAFFVDDNTGQRLAFMKSDIENPLQNNVPQSIDADISSTNQFNYGGVHSNSDASFDCQINPQSATVIKSEIEEPTLDNAPNNNLLESIGSASPLDSQFRPGGVHTNADGDITTKNNDSAFSQNHGLSSNVNDICKLESSDYSEWEELDDPIGVFISEEMQNPKTKNTESDTISETESELSTENSSSDDEMSLLESANPSTTKDGVSPYKRRKKITYKLNFKRPKTAEEFDDFIAKWRPNLECVICSDSCQKFTLLLEHFEKEHPNEKCHIQCCQLKLHHRYEIEEHIIFHQEPRAFKCKVCYKCFTASYTLQTHMRENHSGNPKNIFKCPTCSKCYARKTALQRHIREGNHAAKEPSPTQGHSCSECGKVYKNLKILTGLKKKMHINPSRKSYNCTVCDKTFLYASSLKEHMSSHTGNHIHTCSHCPQTFRYRSNMYTHMKRVHTKELEKKQKQLELNAGKNRRYKCNKCENVYKTPLALNEHKAVHAGKELYTCIHCSKLFKYSSNLYAHMKRIHPKEWERRKRVSSNTDLKNAVHIE